VLGTESDGRIRFTAGGHAIFGRPAIEQDAGAEVALSIRPEKLEVSKTSRDGANSILGTVSGCGYHGNSLQISVETSAGAIRVEAQAWRLGFTPAPGDAVYVTFPDDVPVMLRRDD
jgi:ABC-type Fe3+/spermidine/putrescine transport system ATPase subunit